MSVNFEYYKIFYFVSKYQSFTKAASILLSSQPSISRIIRLLEEELQCKLFTRTQKGVILTPEGEELYDHVSRACEEIFIGEKYLADAAQLNGGCIRIGASEMAIHGYLLEKLKYFHRVYPKIKLKIQNNTTPGLVEDLMRGKIDFAIVTTPTGAVLPLTETNLQPFQDILIAGNDFRALSDRVISLAELKNYPLICLSKDNNTYSHYERLFLSYHLTLDPEIEVATTDLLLSMVTHDLGIGIIPEEFARQAIRNEEVYQMQIKETLPSRNICLVENPECHLSIAANKLKEILCTRN